MDQVIWCITYQAYLCPVEPQCNCTTVSLPAKREHNISITGESYLVTLQVDVEEGDRYRVNSEVPFG